MTPFQQDSPLAPAAFNAVLALSLLFGMAVAAAERHSLPADIQRLLDKWDTCHRPVPKDIQRYCRGSADALAALKIKYATDATISARLKNMEEEIIAAEGDRHAHR